MTQNASDVEIANQGFAAFRQDLNDVLEDITTLHSGTAAPSTTYANQWWYETDTDKLYIRNEDNDAWIEILTLDQANDHLASLGASITLDGTGNVSIDSGDFTVDTNTLHVDSTNNLVGIGTTSPSSYEASANNLVVGDGTDNTTGVTIVGGTSGASAVHFADGSSGDASYRGHIVYNHGSDYMKFATSGQQRMRIDSSGNVGIGTTSPAYTLDVAFAGSGGWGSRWQNTSGGSAQQTSIRFFRNGSSVGFISTTNTATQYVTSSDYRLKENAVDISDGITRVKQLQPKRFNFIDDSVTVDGFMAHEVQSIVPEAISGEKDEMRDEEYEVTPAVLDDDGNVVTEAVMGTRSVPEYQGIDQSKLVPLLTAALQEAIEKIEDLEARVVALESA